jgi:hypothetical protein
MNKRDIFHKHQDGNWKSCIPNFQKCVIGLEYNQGSDIFSKQCILADWRAANMLALQYSEFKQGDSRTAPLFTIFRIMLIILLISDEGSFLNFLLFGFH